MMEPDAIREIVGRLNTAGFIDCDELYNALGGNNADMADYDEATSMLAESGWFYDIWTNHYVRGNRPGRGN